jgi:hypothetical protein
MQSKLILMDGLIRLNIFKRDDSHVTSFLVHFHLTHHASFAVEAKTNGTEHLLHLFPLGHKISHPDITLREERTGKVLVRSQVPARHTVHHHLRNSLKETTLADIDGLTVLS